MDFKNLTIETIHQGLLKKEFSALELVKNYLKIIEEKEKEISAFITICEEPALSKAKEIDEAILANKEIPLLAGVPCAIKDNILVKDVKCTAGSKILENYTAPYDAAVVEKLKKEGKK